MPEPEQGAVSVIIPARNEELNIERVVRSVAAQAQVREIIVVDDASADRTGETLARLRDEIPLLRTMRLDSVPQGWTGKSHAAATGAGIATGEWLLFTDADTEHLPGSLETLLARAEVAQAALLSLSPGQQTPTWWEKAIIPYVFVQLAGLFPFEKVTDPASVCAAANGQYLLIRRSVYNKTGGFESVRGAILDDVELARRVKAAGGRIIFLPGAEWVRTRMYRTFRDMWQGWSKNLFLLYERRPWPIAKALADAALDVLHPLGMLAAAALIIAGLDRRLCLAAGLACYGLTALRQRSYRRNLARLGFEGALATYQAIGGGLFALLLMNSTWAYRVARGVRWKDRKYPVS